MTIPSAPTIHGFCSWRGGQIRTAYGSKYLIVVLWLARVLDTWGVGVSFLPAPEWLKRCAVGVWIAGFLLLFLGRFGLGASFRIGRPRESTSLRVDGLFRLSWNPMYLGVYATLLASVLLTLHPALLLLAAFILIIHHGSSWPKKITFGAPSVRNTPPTAAGSGATFKGCPLSAPGNQAPTPAGSLCRRVHPGRSLLRSTRKARNDGVPTGVHWPV